MAMGELLLGPAREVVSERALPPTAGGGADRGGRAGRGGGNAGGGHPRARHDRRGRLRLRAGPVTSGAGHLVVCPTPIGNLEDVTLRVLAALREADVVACEDTRRTRVLLDRYGVSARLTSYHEHNEERRARELVAQMKDGATVALVSDAGMPLVSDPGYVLVRDAAAAGLEVEVLPGPSAVLAALVASALPADRWRFAGFLPRKARGAAPRSVGAGRDARGVRVAAARAGHAGDCSPRSTRSGRSPCAASSRRRTRRWYGAAPPSSPDATRARPRGARW